MKASVMKQGLSLLLACLLPAMLACVPAAAAENPFFDVKTEDYFYASVLEMYGDGVTTGYEDGSFRPAGSITRAEVLTMICRLAGVDTAAFTVPGGPWYAAVSGWAAAADIVPPGTDPAQTATREEIARYIVRIYRLTPSAAGASAFADTGSAYANTLWDYGVSVGYFDTAGRRVFGGEDAVRRCDVCTMLSRLKRNAPTPDWGALTAVEPLDRLRQLLHDQIWQGAASVRFDAADYGSPGESELKDVLASLYHMPDLFIVEGFNITTYMTYSGVSYEITPKRNSAYIANYEAAKDLYNRELDAIAALVDSGWSDLQKLLFINNYIATHYEYDTSYTNYDAYSFLRDGRGVCEAYSLTAIALLNRLDIQCSYVTSDSLDHAWNIVQLDGNWYHLDLTWNDPVPDVPGSAKFTYFLRSSDAMKTANGGRHFVLDDWVYDIDVACEDTTYDNSFWQDAVSPFICSGGSWYFVTETGLMSWDGGSASPAPVLSFSDLFARWYPQSRFSAYVVRSGLFERGGRLYFNSAFNIICYDPASGAAECLYEAPGSRGDIAGCFLYDDGTLGFLRSDGGYYSMDLDLAA